MASARTSARRRTWALGVAGVCFGTAAAASGWRTAGARGLLTVAVAGCVVLLVHLAKHHLPAVAHQELKAPATGAPDPYTRYRKLHNRLSWGQVSARQFDSSTRPVLTRIAAARLMERRGIDLVRDPLQAREALGPEAYALVDPTRPDATDGRAKAVPLSEVARFVQRLEDL